MSKQAVSVTPATQPSVVATKRSTITKKAVSTNVVQASPIPVSTSAPTSASIPVVPAVQVTPKIAVTQPVPQVTVPKVQVKVNTVVPPPVPVVVAPVPVVSVSVSEPDLVSLPVQNLVNAVADAVAVASDVQVVPAVAEKVNNSRRAFADLYEEMTRLVDETYKRTQLLVKLHKALLQAHKREVSNTTHRESTKRTPTTLFDRTLVDYIHAKLTPAERVITRKNAGVKEVVDLANFDENTRFHRTDVTQLCNLVFKKHGLTDPNDGRKILYQNDAELVKLLTTGNYDPKLEPVMENIRKGTHEMNIFTIQQVLNHRLRRVAKDDIAIPAVASVIA